MKVSKKDRDETLTRLRAMLPPGSEVQCILRNVSRSGMSRTISFYALLKDEKGECYTQFLDGWISSALGIPRVAKGEGLKVNGCGMDMGFHVVYELGYALHGKGWTCVGDRCPSNDHSNGDRDYTPHPHSDGGYALRHRWL